jgi:glycosyltransferase involved in cell wall biosynthesis
MKKTGLKIAALLAFRNEELFMGTYMENMSKIADVILGYDDGSTDSSLQIFLQHGGILVPSLENQNAGQGASLNIREHLLSVGRNYGFTIFIILDCDEIIIAKLPKALKSKISNLAPGEKLIMKWVMADSSGLGYMNEKSVWSPKDKDFAFGDKPDMHYPRDRRFVHFSRTPIDESSSHNYVFIDFQEAFVLHFQFLNWELGQIKQSWYRLYEVLKLGRSYRVVNRTYEFTKEQPRESLKTNFNPDLKLDFTNHDALKFDASNSWYFKDIEHELQKTSRFKVCNIDIWHFETMQNLYQRQFGREHSFSFWVDFLETFRLRFVHLLFLMKEFLSTLKVTKNG